MTEETPATQGSTPNPDPTLLTTEALKREVAALTNLLEYRIEAEQEARAAAVTSLQEHISLQRELRSEQLDAITREMEISERNRVEQKADNLASVAAAFAAQKEAVKEQTTASALSIAKSENATNEQLKQLNVTLTTAVAGVNSTIDDVKERVGKLENLQAAMSGKGAGREQSWGILIAVIVAMGSIFGIIMLIIELTAPR